MDVALSQERARGGTYRYGVGGAAIRSSLCLASWVRKVRVTDQTALTRKEGGAWETGARPDTAVRQRRVPNNRQSHLSS